MFAAVYPEAIDIAVILSSPAWRKLAAGDDDQLSRFTQQIGPRIGVDGYQPRDNLDPIAHWIEQDCWRAPSQPPATFASAPGHRRPGHLAKAVTKASRDRHDNSAWWFSRNRRPGNVILHHRTVHPVVRPEWSTRMDNYSGAIWQAQRTEQRGIAVGSSEACDGHSWSLAVGAVAALLCCILRMTDGFLARPVSVGAGFPPLSTASARQSCRRAWRNW